MKGGSVMQQGGRTAWRIGRQLMALASGLCVAAMAWADGAPAQPVQVMVLGTYHFGNPGLDVANVKADDVLLPARQAELRAVADGLARFQPNRVAVEVAADDRPGRAVPTYAAFMAGERRDQRNEIDQIGFRLARQLGHTQVFGVDVDGDFPFEALQAYATAQGQGAALQKMLDELTARLREFEASQATSTIGQLLRRINEPEAIRQDHHWYMGVLPYGQAAQQPGASLVGSWYARNLGICARLVQLARPGDRWVVVYGSGHSYLLRHCVQAMPGWQLVEANDYLPR
ncbi:DUF5694 domain-containing protein [Ideonella sp. DXS29W]|uniref:DUF5694 domain-containing protein n=1 Tax=Ideonella lacteola TaxID=2984193 RepID=A0ABU9BJU5_9BURK